MKGLAILSDLELIEIYHKAVELDLDQEFKDLLLIELDRRGIDDYTCYHLTYS